MATYEERAVAPATPAAPALAVADPAPLGLAAFALTTFMLSGHNATFIPDVVWSGSNRRWCAKACAAVWRGGCRAHTPV